MKNQITKVNYLTELQVGEAFERACQGAVGEGTRPPSRVPLQRAPVVSVWSRAAVPGESGARQGVRGSAGWHPGGLSTAGQASAWQEEGLFGEVKAVGQRCRCDDEGVTPTPPGIFLQLWRVLRVIPDSERDSEVISATLCPTGHGKSGPFTSKESC